MPMKNPPHPGDFIKTEIIGPAGLSVTDAAKALRVSRPEDLYRTLKARAGLSGVSLGDLVRRLIEQGLRSSSGESAPHKQFGPPPVIIPARGKRIPAISRARVRRMEEEEDEAKHARSA